MPGQPKNHGGTFVVGPWRGGVSRTNPLFGVRSSSARPGHGEGAAASSPQQPPAWSPALHRCPGALLASALRGTRALFGSAHPLDDILLAGTTPEELGEAQ